MATLPDPLATASGPISAYMSGHDSKLEYRGINKYFTN